MNLSVLWGTNSLGRPDKLQSPRREGRPATEYCRKSALCASIRGISEVKRFELKPNTHERLLWTRTMAVLRVTVYPDLERESVRVQRDGLASSLTWNRRFVGPARNSTADTVTRCAYLTAHASLTETKHRWYSLLLGRDTGAGTRLHHPLAVYATVRLPTPLEIDRSRPGPGGRERRLEEEGDENEPPVGRGDEDDEEGGDRSIDDEQVLVTLQVRRGLSPFFAFFAGERCLSSVFGCLSVSRVM